MWILGLISVGWALPTPLVEIPGGSYRPLYPVDPKQPITEVAPFQLEAHPVTIGQYRAFVAQHPEWAPGAPSAVVADAGYLQSWRLGKAFPDDRPVTEVSWFAARAYCKSVGRTLPTEDQWELVARASTDHKDASTDPVWLAEVLAWYGEPSGTTLPPVKSRPANAWGVYDMYGLVWEWVEDFNNTLVASDARESGDADESRFCGVGAISAQDVQDYASFMRIAWRSSLDGKTTTKNLGFRCSVSEGAR